MKIYINYADNNFKSEQKFASIMAGFRGKFDKKIIFTKDDIDKDFYFKNRHILEQSRGGGYWLWKPYFIYKVLKELEDKDYLFYSDSGLFFLKSVDVLIKELEKSNQDIMGFELPLIEKQWTKKELFINMKCGNSNFENSNQIMASYILIKKTKLSLDFFGEYLRLAQNEINITDKNCKDIKQNDEFIEHRHDQSIFSLLYKIHGLKPFKDATQNGEFPMIYGSSNIIENLEFGKLYKLQNGRLYRTYNYKEKYKKILFHNRKGNPIISFIKYYDRRYFNSLLLSFFKSLKNKFKC